MPDETYATPWAALTAKLEDSRATYDRLGAECWDQFDVTSAVRFRGRAEGLKYAQAIMREEVDKRPEDGGWAAVLVDRDGRPVDQGDTFAVAAADGIQILLVRRTALAEDGGLTAGYDPVDALLLWEEFPGDIPIPHWLQMAQAMAAGLNFGAVA
jgi:hypothetical protein